MYRYVRLILSFAVLLGLGACTRSCGVKPAGLATFAERVEELRLPNGMLWLLVEHGEAPVFTGVIQVRVGGINESPGKAGLAHMFEHMAFKGSREVGTTDPAAEAQVLQQIREFDQALSTECPETDTAATGDRCATLKTARAQAIESARRLVVPNEVWQLVHDHGAAEINAFTNKDITGYYMRMPSHTLSLWLYLASHMVGQPVMREFYAERDVVMEERRTSVDNSPRGQLYEAMMRTAFTVSPYRIMAIGPMHDIAHLTMADAEAFHRDFYTPGEMVGVLVGRFDREAAKRAIREYFGTLPERRARRMEWPKEQPQTEERRVEVTFDAGAMVMVGYHKPSLPHRDDYIFDIIQSLLCEGETARLRQRLEKELRLVRQLSCHNGSPGARLDNLFLLDAQPLEGHSVDEVLTSIEQELTRLREDFVAPEELAKARLNMRADFLWGLEQNESLAQQLAYFQTVTGDWRYLIHHPEVMESITPQEVREAARKYLTPRQRTVAVLRKPS